ncbi:MAG TPA: glutamate--tRNA ligase family protein [Myxococcota bacterium]|nr:glutamate--tRNA ligase family protein [Myxococcota bacterium]
MTGPGEVGRFAPSTTGPAHPGTLLAALLGWLDARSRNARYVLRLEDLDPERSRPEWSVGLRRDLDWLGLPFDAVEEQHAAHAEHADALDRLAALGRLYPCACTRTQLRVRGETAPDGSARYPGTCRGRALPAAGWRVASEPLRVRLDPGEIAPREESGLDLRQDPSRAFGDPVVRRRDGVPAYHLASVVDDARSGVTRVVRGRDLAASTPLQLALRRLLGLEEPDFRHHLLLLEERGGKLAKLHGAVGADELRAHYRARELCGFLALAAGLRPDAAPTDPAELLREFDWAKVGGEDRVVRWAAPRLVLIGSPP